MESPTSAKSDIEQFYTGRSVLITGATGFIGKVLVEKLLRSVPGIRRIFVLMRAQKNKTAKERWDAIATSDLFDLVRKSDDAERPSVLEKVVAVNGDLCQSDLAMSEEDARRICEHVSVVFHCAATVKFDEHLRTAVCVNMQGTQRLLQLCGKMKRLDAFVHASTAWSNCDRTYIVERVYPAPVPVKQLMDSLEWMNDEMVDAITPTIVGRRPNTYTLTKALTESLLVEEAKHFPITIVRPSIVGSVWREPKPGWLDSYNGATGLFALAAKGMIRTLYGRLHEVSADIIPVDIVSNMLIVAGWHRSVGKGSPMPVIHCTSGRLNPISWGFLVDKGEHLFKENMPLSQVYREPGGRTTTWRLEYQLRLFFDHFIPACLVDSFLWLTKPILGYRPLMLRLYSRIFKVMDILEYFYTNRWDFQSKMAVSLNEQMSAEDRRRFYIDVRQMDWHQYMYVYSAGVRKYILKEDMSTLAEGWRVVRRRRLIIKLLKTGLWALFLRFLVRRTTIGAKIWQLLMTLLSGGKRMLTRS